MDNSILVNLPETMHEYVDVQIYYLLDDDGDMVITKLLVEEMQALTWVLL